MTKILHEQVTSRGVNSGFLIMAVPRSGTTLLARIMNLHPDIVCGSERFHGSSFSPDHLSETGFRTLDLERLSAAEALAQLDEKAGRPKLIFGEKFPRAYLHMRTTIPRFKKRGVRIKLIVPMRNADEVAQSWYQRAINPMDERWPAGMYGVFSYIEQLLLIRCILNFVWPENVLLVSYKKMLCNDAGPAVFKSIANHIGVADAAPFFGYLNDEIHDIQASLGRDRSNDPTKFDTGFSALTNFASVVDDKGAISLLPVRDQLARRLDAALANDAFRMAIRQRLADASDPDFVAYNKQIQRIYMRELRALGKDFARDAIAAMKITTKTHRGWLKKLRWKP